MDRIVVKIKRVQDNKGLPLPTYKSEGSSGMDITAYVKQPVLLKPGDIRLIPTGLAVSVPPGYEAQVRPRSGLAIKHQIGVLNSPGTIDADYRGEIRVILANLFPVLILPLFYKTSPIEDEDLKKRIEEICGRIKINLQGIFSINLSSKSTKANAAVIGLGNTKKILIGDTLIADYTEDEIMSVLTHEITHYKEHHIWWLILWQSLVTVVLFYILYRIHPFFYELAEFEKISEVAAFPIFAIIFAILSFVTQPLTSSISRFYERKADKGALNLTNDSKSFISLMAKFCNKQLLIAYPNPFIEWYKYSHPSPGNRIKSAETWEAKQ